MEIIYDVRIYGYNVVFISVCMFFFFVERNVFIKVIMGEMRDMFFCVLVYLFFYIV